MVLNAKIKWIAGGIMAAVVIGTVVVFSNPTLQKGFFKLPSNKEMFEYSVRSGRLRLLAELPNCREGEYSIMLGPESPAEGRIVLSRTPGVSTLAQFVITPRNCKLTIQSFDLEWIDLLRTRDRNFNEPRVINLNDVLADTNLRSGEFTVRFIAEPSPLCMQGANSGTLTLSASQSVTITPQNPGRFTVTGILFAESNANPDGPLATNSEYRFQLTRIANHYPDYLFPNYSFSNTSPLVPGWADRCTVE